MRVTAAVDGLEKLLAAEFEGVEKAITAAMREASSGLKDDLRQQTVSAGLGQRLARTWQNKTYPLSGVSAEPAGYVWSKAPRIIAAFTTGATIVPRFMNYLAIPTENVPRRAGGRGAKAKMSPRDVERHFGESLTIRRGKRGSFLGFVEVVRARSRRRPGYRRATSGRLQQGRQAELVLMFIFVPRVRMPRLLNLQTAADRWGARVPALFELQMGKR